MAKICITLDEKLGTILRMLSNVEKRKFVTSAIRNYLLDEGVIEKFFKKKGEFAIEFIEEYLKCNDETDGIKKSQINLNEKFKEEQKNNMISDESDDKSKTFF